jgi:hypothetical protein
LPNCLQIFAIFKIESFLLRAICPSFIDSYPFRLQTQTKFAKRQYALLLEVHRKDNSLRATSQLLSWKSGQQSGNPISTLGGQRTIAAFLTTAIGRPEFLGKITKSKLKLGEFEILTILV